MKLKVNDIENWYFTSDPHYYHEDIIKYCHRPFDNIQHQHEVLINNWNNKVPVDGKVVMAGDKTQRSIKIVYSMIVKDIIRHSKYKQLIPYYTNSVNNKL